MDRIVLYGGGVLLIIGLALIGEWVPDRHGEQVGEAIVVGETDRLLPRDPDDAFHRGMVFGLFPYKNEKPRYLKDFRELRELKVNAVSFNFNWYMDTIYDPTVYRGVADPNNQTASDLIIGQAIADAHSAGLKVMLFPSIYIMHLSEGEWRGKVQPPDWDVWFASYRSLVINLARLAERFGAEYLCIGIELISSEELTDHWRRIIRDVRAIYRGKVLYSANWDARQRRPWFRDLDLIAMNAYYELTAKNDASVDELIDAWRSIRHDIQPWRDWIGLPLVISEVGYRSADGAVTKPWNYFLPGDVDLEEQRRAYEAFFRAWHEDDLFQGMYVYHWFGEGGLHDKSYTPRGKPAADEMRQWFEKIENRDRERWGQARLTHQPQTRWTLPRPDAGPISPDFEEPLPDLPAVRYGPPRPDMPAIVRGNPEPPPPPTLRPVQFIETPLAHVRFANDSRWYTRGQTVVDPHALGGPRRFELRRIDSKARSVVVVDRLTDHTYVLTAPTETPTDSSAANGR